MLVCCKPNQQEILLADTIKIIKEINLPEASISLREDGIVHVHYNENTIVDIPLQLKMLEKFHEITGGKLTPFIFTASDGVQVTLEARNNAIKTEENTPCYGTAVIVTNTAYKLIANFYLKFNKPKRPYKVFSNKEVAVKWLKTIKLSI